MKRLNNKNSKISKLELNKLSVAKLNRLNMIKGGGESIDDGSTRGHDPKDFSQQIPNTHR